MSKVYHNRFMAMNTRCHVVFPGMGEDKANRIFHMLEKEANRIETLLSRFLPESEISKINRSAFGEPVKVNKEVFDILKTCQKYSGISQGAFDISLRPLMQYWNKEDSKAKDEAALEELLKNLGMDHIILDEENQTVSFDNENIEIDLGGFGKGYALEKMNELLQNFSVKHAFISFGESSVLTVGSHPAGDCWKVGLNNYMNPGNSLHTFKIRNGSMSTSSNFYVDDNGKLQNHRHVINPKSGYPIEELKTVSVVSESPVTAEVLSTAMLVSSPEFIESIKEKVADAEVVKVDYQSGEPEVMIFKQDLNE